jgi:spore maturation protein CgeB
MSGALYVTGYMPELETMFEPDREVVAYRNQDELLAKVTRLLREPAEAAAIRVAGRKRALADHTPHVRFQKLFAELGLS